MKFEFIPCTLKYALLARKRSKTDGGTLFFALIDYYAFGKKQTFENEGMQVLFDLFVSDIDEFLAGRKKLSETNANNASCKGNAGKSNNKKTKRGLIAANAISGTSVGLPNDGNDGNAGDYDDTDGEDADDDGVGNDCNDADSSDDGGDGATDDDDSSLLSDNIKPPEVASKPNDRGKHKKSLKAEQHISNDKNGSDRNDHGNSIGILDIVSESSDCSVTQGSLSNNIETNDDNDRSEFNTTQHTKSDFSDRNDRNDRCDSIGTVDVVSESNNRKGDYESVIVSDDANDRNNRDNTDSISQLAQVATTLATAATYSSASVLPIVSTIEDDAATTFARLRDLYNKSGDNESRAFELWQRLSAKERADALSYAESIAGNSGYRSYLYVFLRDKEWLKPKANSH